MKTYELRAAIGEICIKYFIFIDGLYSPFGFDIEFSFPGYWLLFRWQLFASKKVAFVVTSFHYLYLYEVGIEDYLVQQFELKDYWNRFYLWGTQK